MRPVFLRPAAQRMATSCYLKSGRPQVLPQSLLFVRIAYRLQPTARIFRSLFWKLPMRKDGSHRRLRTKSSSVSRAPAASLALAMATQVVTNLTARLHFLKENAAPSTACAWRFASPSSNLETFESKRLRQVL